MYVNIPLKYFVEDYDQYSYQGIMYFVTKTGEKYISQRVEEFHYTAYSHDPSKDVEALALQTPRDVRLFSHLHEIIHFQLHFHC